ncbi:uncharacterized protein LOC134243020 [Saccostrea cucullata]|uniref:uncharacterized protein LOC134243020 n=1 Tax=Saccostrea cuccullata TaxID=36930 RepID=UPI002ED31EF1
MTDQVTPIGYALIVTVKYFEGQNSREDAISDQTNARAAFRRLGFETKIVTEEEPTPLAMEAGAKTEYVTKHRFQEELDKAINHVKNQGYRHFAVFISTHGGEARTEGHYEHELCFYDDDDVSTQKVLFNPLDRELPKVNKLILVSACRDRDDCENEREKEDPGVQIQITEDQDEEYQIQLTGGDDIHHSLPENSLHCLVPCISNCVTMFASPSGKYSYRCHLANLFWDRVKLLSDGSQVNLLELLREINRMFAEKAISIDDEPYEGCYISYEVSNVGSICHRLTSPIHYTVVKNS